MSPCNLQVANHGRANRTSLKSGVGISHINQKALPRTGYQINLRSRATGKQIYHIDGTNILKSVTFKWAIRKFSNIVAAYIEGLRYLPMYLFETLFLVNVLVSLFG
jgi:hypothetical protein